MNESACHASQTDQNERQMDEFSFGERSAELL
jgi:hypothetical protein